MNNLLPRLPVALVLAGLFAAAGCGGGAAPRTVSGKLILPPGVKLAQSDMLSVTFVPEAKDGKTAVADVSPDHTFTTRQVMPGKYKITVAAQAYPGEKGFEQRTAAFENFNKQFEPGTTKLSYEVTQDPNQSITVDLAKGTVTKG
jgi:hypothetical protein